MARKVNSLATLLLVEDSPSDAAIIARSLEASKIGRAEVAPTGRAGLERLAGGRFDAILLDHRLPDMTGLDVLGLLREQDRDIPVIVITGAGSEQVAVEAMKLGASDYLAKDELMTSALPRAVAAVLERQRAARDRAAREAEERHRREMEEALEQQKRLIEQLESQLGARHESDPEPALEQDSWQALSASYQRLTQACLASPQVPPVRELDDFATAAARALISPHQLMALHYAALHQLLASGEREASPEQAAEARLALVRVLLRVMDEYRRTATGATASASGTA